MSDVTLQGEFGQGGAPIVESGSNANGEYVKWADGTMICTFSETKAINVSTVTNVLYRSADQSTKNFPQTFTQLYYCNIQIEGGSNLSWVATDTVGGNSNTSRWGSWMIVDTVSETGATYTVRYFAIGRWK